MADFAPDVTASPFFTGADLLDSARSDIALIAARHGHFIVPKHDHYVGGSMLAYGEYSPEECDVLCQMLGPGMAFIEVGSHMGALSIAMTKRITDRGHALLLEPQPFLVEILHSNLLLNGLRHARVLSCAAGKVEEKRTVRWPDFHKNSNLGGFSLAAPVAQPDDHTIIRPLDDLYDHSRLDVIKIDAEGMELEVLLGAERLMRNFRPALYLENDRKQQSAALIAHLLQQDYRLWWHTPPLFAPDNFYQHPLDHFAQTVSLNMMAIPQEKAAEIDGFAEITDPEDWPL